VIVDTSAIIALLLDEPSGAHVLDVLPDADYLAAGGPTLAETGIVLAARLGPAGKSLLARFVQESGLAVEPFGPDHWQVAVDAFQRFGKGRHAAALNFGDCLTYAAARVADEPLLCVGNDFERTDLDLVRLPGR
jgi:ribonuclease VapC